MADIEAAVRHGVRGRAGRDLGRAISRAFRLRCCSGTRRRAERFNSPLPPSWRLQQARSSYHFEGLRQQMARGLLFSKGRARFLFSVPDGNRLSSTGSLAQGLLVLVA